MARRALPRFTASTLRRLAARTISGDFWHQGAVNRPLLSFASPARGDGRYHRFGGDGSWYASSKEGAAWIEFFRHHTSTDLSPLELKRRVGRVRVEGLDVLDLTDPDVQAALGVNHVDLTDDDLELCQSLSEAARRAGFAGILAPSAAVTGESTLVVFRAGMRRVAEVHSRIQVPPKRLQRLLSRARVPGRTRLVIRRWQRR